MAAYPQILIAGPSWVGDMMMAQSLFITLKQLHPDVQVDVLAPAWCLPILARMPQVRRTIVQPVGHGAFGWEMRKQLGHSLRDTGYDQAIVLPNSWKSALIPWFANIPVRTGWRGEMRYGLLNDLRVLDKAAVPLMVERYVSLAHPADKAKIPPEYPAPQLQSQSLSQTQRDRWQLADNIPLLALCPGAEFGTAKQWPTKHYAAVAADHVARGGQACLMGSAADKETAADIHQQVPAAQQAGVLNLCGETELVDAIDVLAHADAVVSNDSGLMHLAAALNKPLVVVYGATSPSFTPPLNTQARWVNVPVDCGPCFQRECSQAHHRCMQDLLPSQVIVALAEFNQNR